MLAEPQRDITAEESANILQELSIVHYTNSDTLCVVDGIIIQ